MTLFLNPYGPTLENTATLWKMKNFQSNTFGIPFGPHLKATSSPLKNTQSLPSPRILALATINMLRDGAKEIYQEENKMLRYESDMNFMPSASFVYK